MFQKEITSIIQQFVLLLISLHDFSLHLTQHSQIKLQTISQSEQVHSTSQIHEHKMQ